MSSGSIHQLSDADAIFLSMESETSGGHVGALMILDPSSCPGFDLESLREHIAERIALVPRFGWKLQQAPLGLDRPYWVEAEGFDARDHILRTAIPSPGNVAQLNALASRLHAQQLDRTRPLWEAWLIEGLEDGRFGLYLKTHHCLVDGSGGSGLAEVLADLTPEPAARPTVPSAYLESAPAAPGAYDVAVRALGNAVKRPLALLSHARRGFADWSTPADESATSSEPPRLFFNRNISRRRAFATTSLELQRVRDLAKQHEVKLNDVVLSIVGAAFRRWIKQHGESTDASLVALCPVSTRSEEAGLGNQITNMAVALGTELADPIERLRATHRSSQRAKAAISRGSFDWIATLGESLAPAAITALMKLTNLAGDTAPLPGNFVVSNVRATPMPLYLCGARIASMMPLSILSIGQGLNVTVVSYCDRVDVGILVDPDLIPDAGPLADLFEAGLEELELAGTGVVYETHEREPAQDDGLLAEALLSPHLVRPPEVCRPAA
jgi:WS/DGAT/MGAT family acyltransferase